jgi:Undecaprenyl-phosphate glucose phosphotransferase
MTQMSQRGHDALRKTSRSALKKAEPLKFEPACTSAQSSAQGADRITLDNVSGLLLRQSFIVFEIAMVVVCGIVSRLIIIRLDPVSGPLAKYLAPIALCAVLMFYVFRQRGLYQPALLQNLSGAPVRLATSLGLVFLMLSIGGYVSEGAANFSNNWVLIWSAATLSSLMIGRVVFAYLLARLSNHGIFRTKVAIYGEGASLADAVVDIAGNRPDIGIVGIFVPPAERSDRGSSELDELIECVRSQQVDQILIAPSAKMTERLPELFRHLSAVPCDVQLVICEIDAGLAHREVTIRGRQVLLQLQKKPVSGWGAVLKTLEDRIFGGVALLLFSPLFLAIATAIKLDSKGPVFFRQRRHGFNHQVISVWKFRTMHVMEDGPVIIQARRGDERVTRVGRLLRMSSLDELPQLFNVLKGEMSLVGPRPHALAHDDYYSQLIDHYASRHVVKPGMTGWAQVNGFRGPTSDADLMRKRIELDLYYVQHWSIWLDLKILALTPFYGFTNNKAV